MGSIGENVAPSFVKKPALRQEDDGNRLIFECKLAGNPKPDVIWFREDIRIDEDGRTFIRVNEDGKNQYSVILELNDVVETDAGLYKVKAKNKYGEVSASINLNFSPVDAPPQPQVDGTAPTFSKKHTIRQEDDGNTLVFHCAIVADPSPLITWYHNGVKVQDTSKYQAPKQEAAAPPEKKKSYKEQRDEQLAAELAAKKAQEEAEEPKKSGPNFKIAKGRRRGSKDAAGDEKSEWERRLDRPSVPLKATGEPGPPKIVEIQEKYSAVEDQTACCYMFVEGNPAPTFKFYKGATICQEGGRYKLVSDGDNNNMIMLAITKVKTTDEGEYRVVIENCHGKDEKSFMLYVSDSSGMDFRSMLKKKKYAKWGNDDDGPDWGDLKHNEQEEEPVLKEVKKDSNDDSDDDSDDESDDDGNDGQECLTVSRGISGRKGLNSNLNERDNLEKSNMNQLVALSSLQTAAGYFREDKIIGTIIGEKFEVFKKQCIDKKLEIKVWLTALIIAFIEKKYPEEKDSWEMIVEKAKDWLGKTEVIVAASDCLSI